VIPISGRTLSHNLEVVSLLEFLKFLIQDKLRHFNKLGNILIL